MKSKQILLILFFCPLWLIGQYSGTVHYTVKDGLPSSTTYCTVQDNKGFIWIGTDAGLVRFDGTNFKVFTTTDGLPDNEVLSLQFDVKTHRMWIITYCKQACYYRNGLFFTASNDSSLKIMKCDYGEYLNGNIQTNKGEFLYNWTSIYDCSDNKVNKIVIKSSQSPVLQVKRWNDSIFEILMDSEFIEYKNGVVKSIYPYHKHSEWCRWFDHILVRGFVDEYIKGGIGLVNDIQHVEFFYKTATGEYRFRWRYSLESGQNISEFILSKDKYIFSIWGNGVYSLDTNFQSPIKKIWGGNVNSFSVDRDENLWITTVDDGEYLLKKQAVTNYSFENGLQHDNLTSLAYDEKENVYMGNTNGEVFRIEKGKMTPVDLGYGKPLEKIRGIILIEDKLFLISNSTLLKFDIKYTISTYLPKISGGPKSILKLADGNTILVGLIVSIIKYNIKTDKYKETQSFKRVITMAQHPDGRVLCGSLDGLYQYKDDKLIHVTNTDIRLNSRITSLCFSPDSILWIGTPSNGVMAYDGKKILGHITTGKYLSYSGAICRKVVSGKHGEIWVATNSGIDMIRYHLHDSMIIDNITPLNTTDGLLSDDVNDILVHDSLIYVATSHGLTILNENELANPPPAPIYILSVTINDKDSLVHDHDYNLTYQQNNLRIEYVGIILPSAGYIRYQYRLMGSGSRTWETTTNTSIEFRSLSPGNYTFEVAVLDKFGNRSMHTAKVKFNIGKAFYMTFWFWAMVIILILAVGFFMIRSRFKRQQAINTKIIDLEQQALKAQMNPHFIFNCLTAIQHFVNKEDVYSANMYLSNFAKLIRKTLDLSGEQYITLDKEVSYLENYIQLEKMRFQDKFNYLITVNDDVDVFAAVVPPMLLQPIIENAIRHGLRYKDNNEGVLSVNFAKEGTKIVCRIDDNGIGIKMSKELKTTTHVEYQSKGMKLTESRIEAINMISHRKITMEVKDKYDDAGYAMGTLVIIKFEQ